VEISEDPSSGAINEMNYRQYIGDSAGSYLRVRVVYSDFQEVHGVIVPRHIQRYVNGSLQWDVNITSSEVETHEG
jgi:hypothetical protein